MGWSGQGGCERRIEGIVNIKKVEGMISQGGCEHEELYYCDNAKQFGVWHEYPVKNASEKIKIFKRQIIYSLYLTS